MPNDDDARGHALSHPSETYAVNFTRGCRPIAASREPSSHEVKLPPRTARTRTGLSTPAASRTAPAVMEARGNGRFAESSSQRGTGRPGPAEVLEALRGREDGFMLGREDPLLRLEAGLQQSFSLVKSASLAEQLAEIAHDDESFGMLGAERPPARLVTSPKEILGFLKSALASDQVTEVSEDQRGIGVLAAANLEVRGQGFAVEPLGVGELALQLEGNRQVVDYRHGEWIIRAFDGASVVQDTLIDHLGLRETPLP
jgi:hypothetical protein